MSLMLLKILFSQSRSQEANIAKEGLLKIVIELTCMEVALIPQAK